MNKPLTREALQELFEMLDKQDLRPDAKRESTDYPEILRVSATKVEKSEFPHSWRRSDPKSKSKASVARWVCTKCGGWVDFSSGTRPNGHAVPTCSQMSVRAVHDS